MRRSGRGWLWYLPWLILLCAVFVCAAAFCLQNRMDVQYRAVCALYVTPEADRTVEPDRLAREAQLLTQTEDFRAAVLAKAQSDGKSRMLVNAVDHTCVLELSVTGPDAVIVSSLANAAGDELCRQLPQLLPVQEVRVMQRAFSPAAADRSLDRMWLFMVAAVVFLAAVLLICCLPRGNEKISFSSPQADAFCLGSLRDSCRCVKLSMKKRGTLWECADRAMLEEVRQLALRMRISPSGHQAASFLFTAIHSGAQDEAAAALAASELAHQGFRVLYVEAADCTDKMEDMLNVRIQHDLYDYLARRCRLEDAFARTGSAALFYMRAHRPNAAAASFAATPAYAAFMNGAKTCFDYVIVHSAPENETADAAMLCLNADSVILVARDETCTLEQIQSTARRFAKLHKPARGVVFTGL